MNARVSLIPESPANRPSAEIVARRSTHDREELPICHGSGGKSRPSAWHDVGRLGDGALPESVVPRAYGTLPGCGRSLAPARRLRPLRARTRVRRGHTPVATVCGKGSGRVTVAGLVCLKPGSQGHLFYRIRVHRGLYRIRVHRGRMGERRSMSEADYAGLIAAAH